MSKRTVPPADLTWQRLEECLTGSTPGTGLGACIGNLKAIPVGRDQLDQMVAGLIGRLEASGRLAEARLVNEAYAGASVPMDVLRKAVESGKSVDELMRCVTELSRDGVSRTAIESAVGQLVGQLHDEEKEVLGDLVADLADQIVGWGRPRMQLRDD